MGNYEKIVRNYWTDKESLNAKEFAILREEAAKLANEKYSVEEIMEVACSGRAMTARQALAVLTQDRIQEQQEKHHTDF
ncbi:hypothetical protein AUJ42_01735 [Candidatus Collierbacteria bacterium CG1_02_44_10]|uniref:Uncharacterized protein n=3 Tax=Candidatus Collieribacteriota TaxID=1752725 RepID=A0A2H0DUB9_9BACT|nr:hypothetical protein [bacterium]OIN91527.1 MAG: hypothetical protein AUJ42_01735 [Candidatus Collierbacteria bacterium CG1_02_44_10]PIP85744.1 MAG: hypothetical protein COW83_02575 [Candidatus Collierbacteria bacterium CG22_combo_CG10-13_8_21_14_all_43_12]PIR99440.1 MAG: hypothetical protein COT86_04060 [Candidatus Collierbacteria bacterium CG10_big_fil_rev_8_21_14_0_10_43_36]